MVAAAARRLLLLAPAALVEELAMRGYLLTALARGVGRARRVASTSVLFALLHLFNPDPTFVSTSWSHSPACSWPPSAERRRVSYAASMAHFAWNLAQAVVLARRR